MPVLIEVNTGDEDSKSGVSLEEAESLIEEMAVVCKI